MVSGIVYRQGERKGREGRGADLIMEFADYNFE